MRQNLGRTDPYKKNEGKNPHGYLFVPAFLVLLLLCSCARPARYVVISEDTRDPARGDGDQRLICLTKEDARDNASLLELNTESAIRDYEQKRTAGNNAVEDVLYHLIHGDNKKTEQLLNTYGDRIPPYLRLLLKADVASEYSQKGIQDAELVKMYQAAFDVQNVEANRVIIKLRIRQLRYGR
jgi:hypothetical protein